MATIINTPREDSPDAGAGTGVVLGVILVILLALILLFFGLPYLRQAVPAATPAPAQNEISGGLNVQLPNPPSNSGNGQ